MDHPHDSELSGDTKATDAEAAPHNDAPLLIAADRGTSCSAVHVGQEQPREPVAFDRYQAAQALPHDEALRTADDGSDRLAVCNDHFTSRRIPFKGHAGFGCGLRAIES